MKKPEGGEPPLSVTFSRKPLDRSWRGGHLPRQWTGREKIKSKDILLAVHVSFCKIYLKEIDSARYHNGVGRKRFSRYVLDSSLLAFLLVSSFPQPDHPSFSAPSSLPYNTFNPSISTPSYLPDNTLHLSSPLFSLFHTPSHPSSHCPFHSVRSHQDYCSHVLGSAPESFLPLLDKLQSEASHQPHQ